MEALSSSLTRHICTTFPSGLRTVLLMRPSQVYISLRSSACLPGLSGCRMGDGWRAGVLPGACPCSLQRPPSQSRIMQITVLYCISFLQNIIRTLHHLWLVKLVIEPQYNIVLKHSRLPLWGCFLGITQPEFTLLIWALLIRANTSGMILILVRTFIMFKSSKCLHWQITCKWATMRWEGIDYGTLPHSRATWQTKQKIINTKG